jgi:phosphoenolpyruvate synthase/pyruvate phosphate dikinase
LSDVGRRSARGDRSPTPPYQASHITFSCAAAAAASSSITLQPIIEKILGGKAQKMVYERGGSATARLVNTSKKERSSFVLGNQEILQLARWACAIEAHYGQPMDMEWAKDGESGELYIVQARPETAQSRKDAGTLKTYRLKKVDAGGGFIVGHYTLVEGQSDESFKPFAKP